MKIHFTTKGSKSLKAVLVVRQSMFDEIQETGVLEQRGLLFWYVASDGFMMRKVLNSLHNRIHKENK